MHECSPCDGRATRSASDARNDTLHDVHEFPLIDMYALEDAWMLYRMLKLISEHRICAMSETYDTHR